MRKELIFCFKPQLIFRACVFMVVVPLFTFLACKKEHELPKVDLPAAGPAISLLKLKQQLTANTFHQFGAGDTTLTLTISMDETSGNTYKTVFAEDDERQGIQLKLKSSGGLYQGDKIRINLNSCYVALINNQLYIDSLDITKSIVKLSSGNTLAPLSISMNAFFQHTKVQDQENLQSRLVRISDIEFESSAKGRQLANSVTKTSADYNIGTCAGQFIKLRTSGFAKFAGTKIPAGHGDITGVLTQYNDEYTLVLRSETEMNLTAVSCAPPDTAAITSYLYKDFEDQSITSNNWQVVSKQGTTSYTASNFAQANYYARIYNKIGQDFEACEVWLISPAINLQASTAPVLNFKTANSSTTASLSLLVCNNYQAPDETWQELPFTIQKSSFTYCNSGDVNLSAYKNQSLRIAFRYRANAGSGSIWNLDEILVKEK